MRCSSCGEHVPDVYDFCLQCGFPSSRQSTTAVLNSEARSSPHQSLSGRPSRNARPLIIMLAVGGLVIAGIVLAIMLSKSHATDSMEQTENPAGDNRTRFSNPSLQSGDDENPRTPPRPRGAPFSSPQTVDEPSVGSPIVTDVGDGERLVPASFFVPARRYYSVRFTIPAYGKTRVVGKFRAFGGSGNDIEVIILDEEGFQNFANRRGVQTYYNSGKLSIGNIDVRLQAGMYYIVFNNNFSLLSNKNVTTEISFQD